MKYINPKILSRIIILIVTALCIFALSGCDLKKKIVEAKHKRQIKKANKVADKDIVAFSKVSLQRLDRTDSVKVKIEYKKGDSVVTYVDTGKVLIIDCDSLWITEKTKLARLKCPPSTHTQSTDTLFKDKEVIKYDRTQEYILQKEIEDITTAYDELDSDLRQEKINLAKEQAKSKLYKKQRNKLLWIFGGIGLFIIVVLLFKFYGSKLKLLNILKR